MLSTNYVDLNSKFVLVDYRKSRNFQAFFAVPLRNTFFGLHRINKLLINHCHDFTYKLLHPRIRISKLRMLFLLVILKVVFFVVAMFAFDDVQLIELVLFAMDSLCVLLEIPLSAEFLVAELALNLLLHSALMIHMSQHDAASWVPLSTFAALIVLSVLSL